MIRIGNSELEIGGHWAERGPPGGGGERCLEREGQARTTLWASRMFEGHQDSGGQRRALQFTCKGLGVQLHIN